MAHFIFPSEIVKTADISVGGKAFNLAKLSNLGLPVPDFIVVQERPDDISRIVDWWKTLGPCSLAVRSSAQGEDSSEHSFAGQFISLLDITTEADLKGAIHACFEALNNSNIKAYEEKFGTSAVKMNVVIQRQIEPLYSGVYFSFDPRQKDAGWLIEGTKGYGQALVSGHVSPFYITQQKSTAPSQWKNLWTEALTTYGEKIEKGLQYKPDMEWAVDVSGKVWVLQSRPITTRQNSYGKNSHLRAELERISSENDENTYWDGKTFSELNNVPSEMTFELWKEVFTPEGAFQRSLQKLGYLGYRNSSNQSPLERIFGRPYLNLSKMESIYFGPIPYKVEPLPHPHLKFKLSNLTWEAFLRTPYSIYKMITSSLVLQTQRSELLKACERQLKNFSFQGQFALKEESTEDLVREITDLIRKFADDYLVWPLILASLVNSCTHTLLRIFEKNFGEKQARLVLQKWLSYELTTETSTMQLAFQRACLKPSLQNEFLRHYGHRGPGELDLASPRWSELGVKIFNSNAQISKPRPLQNLDEDLKEIKLLHREFVKQEWLALRQMIALREAWKMKSMQPYAQLRNLLQELGVRTGLNDDVFWAKKDELAHLSFFAEEILRRKNHLKRFENIHLPEIVKLGDLQALLTDRPLSRHKVIQGRCISPGLAHGQVVIVRDPQNVDISQWGDNVILVADHTDPAWTALFQKSKGIIVSRGGVLSHCAIVAREMGVPAISDISNCTEIFKEGDHVWLDGPNECISIG